MTLNLNILSLILPNSVSCELQTNMLPYDFVQYLAASLQDTSVRVLNIVERNTEIVELFVLLVDDKTSLI